MKINLLPQLSTEELRSLKKKQSLELVSVVSLVGGILLVLSVFGYWAIVGNELSLVRQKIAQAEVEVNKLVDRESLLRGYKQKVEFLTMIIGKRPPFHAFLMELYSLLPAGVSFSKVVFQEEQIVASGIAASSLNLGDFLDCLRETPNLAQRKITKVTLTSLVKEKGGHYKFSLQVDLG